MQPFRTIRSAITAGSYFSAGCLLPIILLGAMLANLVILFHMMGWPYWIVGVIVVLNILGIDSFFYLAYIVGIVAGFFYTGVWPWSLLAIGTVIVAHLIWWAIILIGAAAQPKKESDLDIDKEKTDQPISIMEILNEDFVITKEAHKYLRSLSSMETNISNNHASQSLFEEEPKDEEEYSSEVGSNDQLPSTEILSIFDDKEFRPKNKAWSCDTGLEGNSTKGKMNGFRWKSFLVIIVLIIAAVLTSGIRRYWKDNKDAKDRAQAEKAIGEIQNILSDLVVRQTDSDEFTKPIDESIDTTPKAKGEWGKIEQLIKEYYIKAVKQRNDYSSELANAGLGYLLDAERIKNDDSIIESMDILRKAKLIVAKYKNRTDDLMQELRDNINITNFDPSFKRGFLVGFDRANRQSSVRLNRLWILEDKMLGEMEKIIVFLNKRKGKWDVQEGKFVFSASNDLAYFNACILSIELIQEEQKEIQKKQIEDSQRALDSSMKTLHGEHKTSSYEPTNITDKSVTSTRPCHQETVESARNLCLPRDIIENIDANRETEQDDMPQKETPTNTLNERIKGRVSNVSGDLIQINFGLSHGITKGMKLILYRKDRFVGIMEVIVVHNTSSIGKITLKNIEPRVGDGVVDRLD